MNLDGRRGVFGEKRDDCRLVMNEEGAVRFVATPFLGRRYGYVTHIYT